MSRALIAVATAALFAAGSPSATAQSTGVDRALWDLQASKTRECDAAGMARCWYLFFASNEAPHRQLWLADIKVRNPEPGNADLIEIDITHLHEGDDPAVKGSYDFVLYTLQFQCRQKKYRVVDGFALNLDGSIEAYTGAKEWHGGYEDTWVGLAGKIACEKKYYLAPDANNLRFFGDFHRPVDAADVIRSLLWKPR